ncbi:reverse transcriptase [Diplodia corticola]|uniref:ribonuclease H n=1 Tax=Diplodia corticola TaxID=236234 RepID=A0A1J9R0F2_9PEZI|nr:reverse transcriptase [Diplodia corticola]OJD34104.1 reverse transcriptase [Diplodia corticola]
MLKTLGKPLVCSMGNHSTHIRRNPIAKSNAFSQNQLHKDKHVNNTHTTAVDREKPTALLPPPVVIAPDASSAIANHDRKISQPSAPPAIYTDGSALDTRVGASAFAQSLGTYRQDHLDTRSSTAVETAELMGIAMAIDIAIDTELPEFLVFSDSQAALIAIQQQMQKSNPYIVDALAENLQKLRGGGVRMELHWVPGHKGIAGNVEADKLAKEAARGEQYHDNDLRARDNTSMRHRLPMSATC